MVSAGCNSISQSVLCVGRSHGDDGHHGLRGIIFDPERKLKGIGIGRIYSEPSAREPVVIVGKRVSKRGLRDDLQAY